MKRLIIIAAVVALCTIISACKTSDGSGDGEETSVTTSAPETTATEPAPVYAEFTATLENSPDKEKYYKNQPYFLTPEQKEIWSEAYYMTSASVTGASFGLTGEYESLPRKSLDGKNEYHYKRTGISYDSFYNYITTAFTEDYAKDVFLGETYINDNGELLFQNKAREADISYRSGEFQITGSSDTIVRFRINAFYSWEGIAKLGYLDKGETESHSEEHYFGMVKTDSGWRVNEFDFWL